MWREAEKACEEALICIGLSVVSLILVLVGVGILYWMCTILHALQQIAAGHNGQ